MKKSAMFLIGLTGCISFVSAQEVVSSAGISYTTEGYEISWTLGEPVIETVSNGSNILTQGFHQANLYVTRIDELKFPGIELKVYPNPTDYILSIQSEGLRNLKLQFLLFDTSGKILLNKNIIENPMKINFLPYASGNYILSITTSNGELVQKFKIVKR